jgi:CheY-like chemotaxis protein
MSYCALVIEDDSATSFIFQQVLASLGLTVKCASDGATALDCLDKNAYDIVFMDLLLPRVSGRELLEKRSQIEHLKDCPVVVVTAHSRMKDEIALGPRDQFLTKPVLLRDLFDVVGNALPDFAPVDS